MYDLGITIIHHSKGELVKRCIDSFFQQKISYKVKIILLDNNSNDGVCLSIKQKYPQIDLISSNSVNGFGANQNIMINKWVYKCIYIMPLNNDVILMPNCIENLISFIKNNKVCAAASPLILNENGSVQPVYGPIPNTLTHIIRLLNLKVVFKNHNLNKFIFDYTYYLLPSFIKKYLRPSKSYNDAELIDRISGCCVIIRAEIIKKIGNFDEQFYMYSEDSDWSLRAKKANLKLFIVPSAKLIHFTSSSSNYISDLEKELSMIKYLRKNFNSKIGIFSVKMILIVKALLHIIQFKLKIKNNSNDHLFYKKIIKSTLKL